MANQNDLVLGVGDFNGHVGKCAEGFEGIHIGKRNAEGRLLLDICDQKELCVANTRFKKKDKKKVTYSSGGNDTEIDFVLVGKEEEVSKRCESYPWGIATQASSGGCGGAKIEEE